MEFARVFAAMRVLVLLFLAALLPGCGMLGIARKPVPPPIPSSRVINQIRQDTHRFHTVVDTDISLYMSAQRDGAWDDMPSLGGILAFDSRRPGIWLRTEKLGQKIFSLRAGTDYFWLEIPDTREVVTGSQAAYNRLPQLIHPSEAMLWFAAPEWLGMTWENTKMVLEDEHYRYDVFISGQLIRQVYVDRRDLHLSRIKMYNFFGQVNTEVVFDDYVRVGEVNFPFQLIVLRPMVGYRIELRLDDPTFNKHIPERAFQPRDRPGWDHINLDYEPVYRIQAFHSDS